MKLLSPEQLAAVKSALGSIVDTFYVTQIIYRKRDVSEDEYGENAVVVPHDHPLRCKLDYSVGRGGRYDDIEDTMAGKIQHSTWHVRLWNDDVVAAGITIDPEADSIIYNGKEYRFNFAAEDGTFSDLGSLFWELEIRYE